MTSASASLPVPSDHEPIPPGAGPSLFGHHLRFYGRYAFGAGPVLAESLSTTPASARVPGMDARLERRLRLWVMLRGLMRDNRAFQDKAAADARDLLAILDRDGTPATPREVKRLDVADAGRDWAQAWLRAPRPVILRGVDAPAFGWTVEQLMARCGDTSVLASTDDGVHGEVPLRSILERDVYVHNNGRLFVEHEELARELGTQALAPWFGVDMTIAQLFVGHRRQSATPFHCANNINGVYMCEGRKKWTLVDPAHSMLMYPWLSDHNTYQTSLVGVPGSDTAERFPLYRYCPRYEVVLEPGDLLLNPPWWWHAVSCETDRTVSAATRWYPGNMPDTNRLFSFLHAEPQFVAHILGTMLGYLKARELPNLWLIFEETAHDNATNDALTTSAREAWGLTESGVPVPQGDQGDAAANVAANQLERDPPQLV